MESYRLVCGAPSDAMRLGLRKDSVRQGDSIIVEVNEDSSSRNFGETISTLPGGPKVGGCVLQ